MFNNGNADQFLEQTQGAVEIINQQAPHGATERHSYREAAAKGNGATP